MKQRFLLALVFVCAFMVNSQAQISKGTVWVGGSIGYNQNKVDYKDTARNAKTSSLRVSPSIGIAVKDNLIIGIRLSYGHDKSKNYSYDGEGKTNSYGGGIFVRQYIPVISRLYLFGEASVAYTSLKAESTSKLYDGYGNYIKENIIAKSWGTDLNVTPGLAFAITKKFQIETSLNSLFNAGYSKTKNSTDRPNPSNNFNQTIDQFNAGIFTDGKVQFNVGVRFLL